MSDDVRQIFVRNDKGKTWGPLALGTVELLVDNGLIDGQLQISEDGLRYEDPGQFLHLRGAFPKELWGKTAPGETVPYSSAPVPVVQGAGGAMRPGAPPVLAQKGPTGRPSPVIHAGPNGHDGATDAAPGGNRVAGTPTSEVAPATSGAGNGAGAANANVAGAPVAGPGAFRAGPGAIPTAGPGAVRAGPGATRPPAPRGPPPVMGKAAGPNAAAGKSAGATVGNASAGSAASMDNAGGKASAAGKASAGAPETPGSSASSAAAKSSGAATPPASAPLEMSAAGDPPPPSGDLSRHTPLHLYYLAGSGDHTGLLTFTLPDRTVGVHFRKGNPESITSTASEDSVSGFLVRSGQLTEAQLASAEAQKDKFGGELIPALFGLGLLNPGTAFAQLAQHATQTLMKALIAEAGSFTWEPKELPPHKAMPLGNRWAILSDFMRRVPMPIIRRKLQDALDHPIMKSGGRVAIQELRLSPQETRALGFIDGVRSLLQLAADLPADADNFLRVAFLLKELEMISFAAVKLQPRAEPKPVEPVAAPKPIAAMPPSTPATAAKAPTAAGSPAPTAIPANGPGSAGAASGKPAAPSASAKPDPAAPAASPAAKPVTSSPTPVPGSVSKPAAAPATAKAPAAPEAPRDLQAELLELRKLVAGLKEQNLFEILGLKQDANAGAVKIAYFKLAKAHHPDTVPQDAPPELSKLKADFFAAVGEAYRRLSDDKSRADYLDELKHGGSGEQIDVQAILMAEEMFQKGQILVKAKKFADAVKLLDDAIKANAEEGEFYAWRGIAKFFANPERGQGYNEAYKDTQLALKKNPRCAQAYFFQGQMAKLMGDNSGAQKNFAKTVELQPAHVDAQRELRMNKK